MSSPEKLLEILFETAANEIMGECRMADYIPLYLLAKGKLHFAYKFLRISAHGLALTRSMKN
jgi:hypothetical protein